MDSCGTAASWIRHLDQGVAVRHHGRVEASEVSFCWEPRRRGTSMRFQGALFSGATHWNELTAIRGPRLRLHRHHCTAAAPSSSSCYLHPPILHLHRIQPGDEEGSSLTNQHTGGLEHPAASEPASHAASCVQPIRWTQVASSIPAFRLHEASNGRYATRHFVVSHRRQHPIPCRIIIIIVGEFWQ